MLAGERLYQSLASTHKLFDGTKQVGGGAVVFETFPHAIVWCLRGEVVPAKGKAQTRRGVLRAGGLDVSELSNTDFVDAALCAVTAERFTQGRCCHYGDSQGGFIVVPRP